MHYYTGIGSRETPEDVLVFMRTFARRLADLDWIVRSGGAQGADRAFETGAILAGGKKEIYLPWKGYNDNVSPLYSISDEALELAERVWNETRSSKFQHLKRPVKLLMARNCYQILGQDLHTPSKFVICWTPDGCTTAKDRKPGTGGTGQAIALADKVHVPIINLANYPDPAIAEIFIEDYINAVS